MPEIGTQPARDQARLRHVLIERPGFGEARAEATGEKVIVAEADHRGDVLGVADVECLVDQLGLGLEHDAVAELDRIAGFERGSEAEAVGVGLEEARGFVVKSYQVPCRTLSRYQPLGPKWVQ